MTASADLVEVLRQRGLIVADEKPYVIGRPDRVTLLLQTRAGTKVIAKQVRGGGAARLFENMRAVWNSSFGGRRAPAGLPQPLDCIPELELVLMEHVAGQTLAEMGNSERFFESAIQLIAALHGSDAVAETERSSRSIVRSLQRKAETIVSRLPDQTELIREAVAAIEAHRVKDSELVPSHGDCSPRNVLAADRLVLIDWERFQMSDPARDIAYFATWHWPEQLRRGRRPDDSLLKRAVAIYEAARPGAALRKRLRFHAAAGLIRRAASLVELWPERSYLVPALARTALRQFE